MRHCGLSHCVKMNFGAKMCRLPHGFTSQSYCISQTVTDNDKLANLLVTNN